MTPWKGFGFLSKFLWIPSKLLILFARRGTFKFCDNFNSHWSQWRYQNNSIYELKAAVLTTSQRNISWNASHISTDMFNIWLCFLWFFFMLWPAESGNLDAEVTADCSPCLGKQTSCCFGSLPTPPVPHRGPPGAFTIWAVCWWARRKSQWSPSAVPWHASPTPSPLWPVAPPRGLWCFLPCPCQELSCFCFFLAPPLCWW